MRCAMFSVLDMFSVGVGPSSSHTVGPMRAARAFVASLEGTSLLSTVARVQATLYGSLSLTGFGHGTDRAVIVGLEGAEPNTVDTNRLLDIKHICMQQKKLALMGKHIIPFDVEHDVAFDMWHRLAEHPNGMRFQAYDRDGEIVDEQVWYSVGGGFIRQGRRDDAVIGNHDIPQTQAQVPSQEADVEAHGWSSQVPYQFASCNELVELCEREGKSIGEVIWANETSMRPAAEVRQTLLHVWHVMSDCIHAGCTSSQQVLPGGLDVPRRAPDMYARLTANSDALRREPRRSDAALESSDAAWVNLFALAVSEENAGGGRIVTAPTNGSAGIMPAVLQYYWNFVDSASEDGVVRFLLTAGAIGYLFKRNASISGAEVGCQGEVGSACSMASAGLCEALGGSPRQVENAAEIGIEHHLGLTCDPVGGLVQIPCIERNAMAANTAINAVRMAMLGNGSHIVSLDQAIKTMKDTGEDMMSKYKETSQGGLAVNVVEC